MKREFAKSFRDSNLVLLCPMYSAGEKKNNKFNKNEFAKLISKLSKTQVIMINDYEDLEKYLKKNLISNEIIIGMGAGLISKYMRSLEVTL